MRASWDIFCRVIDNFGDIGVTWRLAQQLQREHDCDLRLWVDDLHSFHKICPEVAVTLAQQEVQGVEVRLWSEHFVLPVDLSCADVVIEAFACQLPDDYIALMQQKHRVLWLNLEYLTAEPWAAECHAMPSMQNGGLKKYFFFPGFTDKTGGLLRETHLLAQRDAFLGVEQTRLDYLAALAVQVQPGERLISLFAYANQTLPSFLAALSQDTRRNRVLLLQGPLSTEVARWFDVSSLEQGCEYQRGTLTVHCLPYITQQQFDQLLWCCDLNCVRGEDSFVRAQWAAKPFLWHIYPQHDEVHLDKLAAFLTLYNKGLNEETQQALTALWKAWNQQQNMLSAWQGFTAIEETLQSHAACWSARQNKHADLATNLVHFYHDWL